MNHRENLVDQDKHSDSQGAVQETPRVAGIDLKDIEEMLKQMYGEVICSTFPASAPWLSLNLGNCLGYRCSGLAYR